VLVREGGLDEGNVNPGQPPAEQLRRFREKDGGVIGDALVDRVPGAVADEEGVVAEVLLEFLRGIRGHAEGTDMDYFGVEKGLGVRLYITDQTLDQMLGFGAGRADEDGVPPVDVTEDLRFRDEFIRIKGLPFLQRHNLIPRSKEICCSGAGAEGR